jgi:dienelactone hydrolase
MRIINKILGSPHLRGTRIVASICFGSTLATTSIATAVVTEVVHIPIEGAVAGSEARMYTGIYRPAGDGPFPVIVYSHGRSGSAQDRSLTQIPEVRGHVGYWLSKGFAVIASMRPGYGQTGDIDREGSGVRYDVFGNCWGPPDFRRAAAAAADAVLATLAWTRQQRWADANRIVLIGTSMGGLASVATAAANPGGVVAYINFAGGTGGDGGRAPGHSCGSDEMASLMSVYGKTTRVPSLWLYATNDSYWGDEWPRVWHRAFARGGSPTRFVMTDAVPNSDGHALLARGSALWIPFVEAFLDAVVFGTRSVEH